MELAHPSILKATTTHTQFPQMAVFLPLTWEKNPKVGLSVVTMKSISFAMMKYSWN